jgi:hypothetical protein
MMNSSYSILSEPHLGLLLQFKILFLKASLKIRQNEQIQTLDKIFSPKD